MPNMSNKNFPHAHGSGRVSAAFSICHLAGTPGSFDSTYLPGAPEMLTRPPAFVAPFLPTVYPYPQPTIDPLDPANTAWAIQRQPYNATSLGVFVTGSGTRRLPYQEALGLFVPAGLSPKLAESWPNNDLYPYALVDDTQIGSTHGQVVCETTTPEEPFELGPMAYYEVGLNWEIPKLRAQVGIVSNEALGSNFANQAQASFERALERTFWVTASLSGNALCEAHPEVDWAATVANENYSGGPVDSTLSLGRPGTGTSYYSTPYSNLSASGPLEPSTFPWPASASEAFRQRPAVIQTQLSAIVTRVMTMNRGDGTADVEVTGSPIVRVWVSVPVEAAAPGDSPMVAPRPLPRAGVSPYLGDPAKLGRLPPAVNVQVTQKNTAAVDGTDGPIYDLVSGWSQLGEASLSPTSSPEDSD